MKKEYQKVTISEIERVMTELFSKKLYSDEPLEEEIIVYPKTPEQVEEIIADPLSGYHKILNGYWYAVDGNMKINTGYGGAQFMYKTFLQEGMEEDMIQEIIFVYVNDAYYPLSCLNVKQTEK